MRCAITAILQSSGEDISFEYFFIYILGRSLSPPEINTPFALGKEEMREEYNEGGYYNDFGEWIDTNMSVTPEIIDSIDDQGRLIDQQRLWELSQPDLPEDFNLFLSKYEQPWMSSQMDWEKGT